LHFYIKETSAGTVPLIIQNFKRWLSVEYIRMGLPSSPLILPGLATKKRTPLSSSLLLFLNSNDPLCHAVCIVALKKDPASFSAEFHLLAVQIL
jgi:hypothetical protein